MLYLYPEATKWIKNVLSLKKSLSLALTSTLEHGIESCFEFLTIPRKQVQDRSKEFLGNENNNNKKISWKSHWSQWSLHDKYGWSKVKDWR